MLLASCSGSKQSSGMRQIEKHSKKNPVDENGLPVALSSSGSKQVKQTLAQQQKQKAAADKEAEKAYKDAVTRHRAYQTQETRDRMDQHLKETNKRHRKEKELFLVRWFRPKDDIEKIEKRQAKETQKRMAATRKKAESNNKNIGLTRTVKTRERKMSLPDPKDMPQGGGGTYTKGRSGRGVKASDYQQGGGGTYRTGKAGVGKKASDYQQGGGGSYQAGRSGTGRNASDYQQGGGGTYRTGRSETGKKPSDYQQGGGGNMSGKTNKRKSKQKK